jgi:hypothetical protein
VLLLSLLQAASPWPASSSDSIFQTRTVFCLKTKALLSEIILFIPLPVLD